MEGPTGHVATWLLSEEGELSKKFLSEFTLGLNKLRDSYNVRAFNFADKTFYDGAVITMREATENSVRAELRNLGHNLSEAVYSSFSGAVCLTYAGVVAERAGVSGMLILCAALSLVPVAVSLAYGKKMAQGRS